MWREREKKKRNFGPSGGRGSGGGGVWDGARRVAPRVWGPGLLGVGLQVFGVWEFGFCGLRKFGQNTETINLAKVGLAKVGQNIQTQTLAKIGQSRFGQSRSSPQLAKVGLAKVGLAKVGHDRPLYSWIRHRLSSIQRERISCGPQLPCLSLCWISTENGLRWGYVLVRHQPTDNLQGLHFGCVTGWNPEHFAASRHHCHHVFLATSRTRQSRPSPCA